MIDLDNLTFSYSGKPIISGLSLRVPKGTWLGLIGPNGAGKTTLIKLISGTLTPNSGTINISNKNVTNYSRRDMAKLLAVVPQTSEFSFPFSTLEVVLMGRAGRA